MRPTAPPALCTHLAAVESIRPGGRECLQCVKTGSRWLHLRTCQTCGLTHCCDSSPNKHATAHFQATAHPVIASAEPGERWLWCYADGQSADY